MCLLVRAAIDIENEIVQLIISETIHLRHGQTKQPLFGHFLGHQNVFFPTHEIYFWASGGLSAFLSYHTNFTVSRIFFGYV